MIRNKRDAEDYEEESNNIWDDDRAPAVTELQARRGKRQRNTCRRRPLYVDFSVIHYDTWIVAPNGYEVGVTADNEIRTLHTLSKSIITQLHRDLQGRQPATTLVALFT
jgi:hypothetical protein